MSHEEKLNLLNSAFKDVGDSVDVSNTAVPQEAGDLNHTMSDSVGNGEDDYLDMFGEGGGDEKNGRNENGDEPPKKRRKTGEDTAVAAESESEGDSGGDDSSGSDDESEEGGQKLNSQKRPYVKLTTKQQKQLDLAKNKLSKWAARLFDPNRPRGLVEPPKVIPLNDEFLTAFGKREKEYDEISGREIDIDKKSLDIIDGSDIENEDEDRLKSKDIKEVNFSEMKKCKVKLSNLSYKTTSATITRTCEVIGPVVDVNLILDEHGQSSGRAYVVFEDHETAISCAEKMNEKQLEGRTVYVTLAAASGRKSSDPKKQESRYWERDISTKCNYCGEVGHIAKKCPNEQNLKPCGLCAVVGHEMWSCPQKSVCFNCGVPGHVSRECNQRRGLPERMVCTICYRSGHHRFDCRERPWNAPYQDAVCMQCGQQGHLMCSELRWFFFLKGVSCFNCGENGHRGVDCRRPNVDECHKDFDVALREINRSGVQSLSEQVSNHRSNRESRDGRMRQHSNNSNRPRSMPPPRNRGNNDNHFRGGSNPRNLNFEPPPQRSHRRF